jgi:ABC-type uncharacterized transport system ATPase subunit
MTQPSELVKCASWRGEAFLLKPFAACCAPILKTIVTMSDKQSTLSTHNLNKRYKSRTVVHDVSFEVLSGEVVGLLGPNGAGKTTCFYMVVGLVACDGGDVHLDGVKLTHLPIHRRARLGSRICRRRLPSFAS